MFSQLRRVAAHRGLQVSALRGLRCVSGWATVDPRTLCGSNPGRAQNLVAGRWKDTAASETVVDPLNGEEFLQIPDTSEAEVQEFVDAARSCPKTGLHNPLKNPERYQLISNVCNAAGQKLRDEETLDFFTRLVQRVSPKSYAEAQKEVVVTRKFLENFASDNGRFLARSFGVPGDHAGQESRGYRFPYGHVGLVLPFNFPIEIPVLQLMGALLMGNRPTLKIDSKVSIVIEQFLRMCVSECGLPAQDADLLHASGPVTQIFLEKAKPRTLLFTGSSKVSEKLFQVTGGKMRTEDAGFDWKVLGPDGPRDDTDTQYVAWQCDQDAYACSGQKCSAQSVLFAHTKWSRDSALLDTMGQLAGRRRLDDLTVGPVLTWTTEAMLEHANKLAALPGAEVLFGGKELHGGAHSVPKRYGLIEPTAVKVPLEVFASEDHFELCTTEVFGPMQVVVEWGDGPDDEDKVLECLERMEQHLTAAVVSRDMDFQNRILQSTVNGTTYTGIRARTTGAPQNHWFGPSGDPRGAGIGTPEAIQLVWSHHREIIHDQGPLPENWTLPEAT